MSCIIISLAYRVMREGDVVGTRTPFVLLVEGYNLTQAENPARPWPKRLRSGPGPEDNRLHVTLT